MEDMNYCVYAHLNKVNGKVYVGTTGQSPLDRFNNGWGYHKNPEFSADIKKYGWENFEHMILDDCLTKEEAFRVERFFIESFEATDPEQGYNRI